MIKNTFLKDNSGITLIALVITIVVLIILAVISINVIFGDNGIVTRTQDAKNHYEASAENEASDLENLDKNINTVNIEDLGIGWTLGNSLDSYRKTGSPFPNVSDYETYWNNPVTTKEMIDVISNAGYKTLLIPVTWYQHLDENYNIDPAWLNRVEEIVDYALDNNMYVIINTHHDDKQLGLELPANEFQNTINKYKKVWNQIATHFQNKSQKLIFQLLNEPRIIENEDDVWHPDSDIPYQNLNNFTKEMVASIRQTEANNSDRWILVPYYGAAIVKKILEKVELPNDNHIALSAHAYLTHEYTSDSTIPYSEDIRERIRYSLGLLNDFRTTHNIPIVITETGCVVKEDRNTWIRDIYYLSGKYRIPVMYWDSGNFEDSHGIFDRNNLEIVDKDLVSTAKTYYNYTKNAINVVEGINTLSQVDYNGPDGMGIKKVDGKNHYFMNTTPANKYRFKFSETYNLNGSGIYEFSCKVKTKMSALDIKVVIYFYDENDNVVHFVDYYPITKDIDGSKDIYDLSKLYYIEGAKKVKIERLHISEMDVPVDFELYDISISDLPS